MKKLLLIISLIFISAITVDAECTKEQKAQMIMNGIDQVTIDTTCSAKKKKKAVKNKNSKLKRYAVKRNRVYTSVSASLYQQGIHYIDGTYGDDSESLAISLKLGLGYVFSNNDRVEVVLDKGQTDIEAIWNIASYSSYKLNYIHTFGNKQVEVGSVRPFVLVGLATYRFEEEEEGTGNIVNGSGYNVGIGISYSYNNYVEFDLSYDYSFVTWDDISTDYAAIPVTIELESYSHGPSIAVRYKF